MQVRIFNSRCSIFFLLAALFSAFFACTKNKLPTQNPQKRYNVFMIVSDALRQDVLGCYGGRARTPNIDALAEMGILFENAFSTSPWTSPSAVSMLTANYASTYGFCPEARTQQPVMIQIYVPDTIQTFTESLKKLNYITSIEVENVNVLIHNILQGTTRVPEGNLTRSLADSIVRIAGFELFESRNDPRYRFVFWVLKQLYEMKADDNFFMLHWILDPHAPYDPAKKFMSRIDVDETQLSNSRDYYSQHVSFNESNISPAEKQYVRDLYVAEVESVDERVGFIINMLEHKNLMDDTYIVFTSDHGEEFGQHGLWGHGGRGLGTHYYEGLIRVPLIIAGPGLSKGKRIKDNVSLIDLMPTLKDCLGIEHEEDVQGKSFCSLLFQDSTRPVSLYFDNIRSNEQIDALIEGNYKLISLQGNKNELYDIFSDPHEQVNFAARNPELVSSMYEKLLQIRQINEERQEKNIEALDFDIETESRTVNKEILQKLKSLGYINWDI